MKRILLLTSFLITLAASSQTVYEHISSKGIYHFLDELANNKIIELNSAVKPYARMFIAEKLKEASEQKDKLNKRQQRELRFYARGYTLEMDEHPETNATFDVFKKNKNLATAINPFGILYKDSVFSFSLKPVWGIRYFFNDHGSVYHRWGGAEMYGYIGSNLSFYASLRDNNETEWLSRPDYLNRRQGVPVKGNPYGGVDYSEMRGGIFYTWQWGSAGLAKDHLSWGSNYHGANIFSGKQPSFGQIQLNLKPTRWFEFHYFHGWLVSEVVDSSRSYWDNDTYREVFHGKYIAANFYTFIPVKRLNLSFGNSIVYSDIGVQAVYLIPFLFYKSVDHTLNSTANNTGQNSQMFFDISSRNLKHLHLYATAFIDEFKLDRLRHNDQHNFISWKCGFRLSDFPLQNLALTAEYTRTNPGTYQHYISTTTYESNGYNMGHYLKANSEEYYIGISFKPLRGLHFKTSWMLARHGNDIQYTSNSRPQNEPVLKDITWEDQTWSLSATYEFTGNAYLFAELILSDIQGHDADGQTATYYLEKFTPELFWGQKTTASLGFNIGF
ncbi:MAG: hypothetical protein R6T99_00380 [Bacteroidales bacterium]